MMLSRGRRLAAALAVVLAVLVLLVVISFAHARRVERASFEAAETQRVLVQLQRLATGIEQTETAVRGYLLTGSPEYLQRLYAGRVRAPAALARLRLMERDDTVALATLSGLALAYDTLISVQNGMIEAGPDTPGAIAGLGRSHELVSRIRGDLDAMMTSYQTLLAVADTARGDARLTPRVMLVSSLVAVLFFSIMLIVLFRDVRRRERTERELRVAQQRLLSLTSSLEDMVFALDREGRITEIYGRLDTDASELLGKGARELFGDGAAVHEEANRRALAGLPAIYDWTMNRGDRPPVQYQTSVAPLREADGRISGIVGVTRDVTAAKETERRLASALSDADRANRAKNEFLSRVSHELRTPLHAILGYGQLLAQEDLDVEAADSVDHILRGGKHLLALINEILDISRIESGTLSLSIETVRVWEVVDEVCSFLSHAATPRTITLEVNVTRNLWVRADRQRLRQVLVNLGSNAIKYNRDGGHVDFIAEPSNGVVRIGVRDTGIGIDPAKQTHLFEPFQRLGADEMGVEGVGLGLVVSKALVEAMGGRIEVQSLPGVGSTFWTELTRVAAPVGVLASDDQFVDPHARADLNPDARTVLYIEDNEANLQLVRRILALQGDRFRFIGAADGLSGLEHARTVLPDLILLDLHLPEIDGEVVLQRLREDPSTRDIPVVVLSADATPSRIERLVREGVFAYLTKPLDIAGFVATIHDALQLSARE
ncbi:MAG TPA: ATP-binding protein [Longimicrobiales bacterium]|nr:ATP-binding protein [Longimicrobiales bacterium]